MGTCTPPRIPMRTQTKIAFWKHSWTVILDQSIHNDLVLNLVFGLLDLVNSPLPFGSYLLRDPIHARF